MKGSLMATTVAPFASAARSTRRPIRPNPLIPMSAMLSEIMTASSHINGVTGDRQKVEHDKER
jgi:hypothetical protein